MSDDVILDEFVEEGRLVTLAEVKAMLAEAQESREELTYEQKIALEHARRFARVGAAEAASLVQELKAAFPAVDEKFAVRIADLLPQHVDDVQSILQKARVDLSAEDLEKVLDIVDKHYVA